MNYYLVKQAALKWLETPSVYHISRDELHELDGESFRFFKDCASHAGCNTKDSAFIDYCLDEGLLTTEKITPRRPQLEQSASPSLRYLELQITSACNLACKHCYLGEEPHQELPAEQVRAVLAEFEEMQGLRVLITGGEPLLHREFSEINEMLPDFYVRKVLFTNGTLLKRETLRGLKVDEIQVSIDGLERAHDSLRGTGTFRRTLEAVTSALDSGFQVSVATMVHGGNLDDFDEMERLFKTRGVKDWTVDVPCATGRLREHVEFHVDPDVGGKYLGYGYGGGMHTSEQGYGCGLHLMAVMPDGRAAKCTFYGSRAIGRIEEGLRACWQRIKPVRLDTLQCDCEYLEACRGGCRYRAELLGSHSGKDLYRCSLYGIIDKSF